MGSPKLDRRLEEKKKRFPGLACWCKQPKGIIKTTGEIFYCSVFITNDVMSQVFKIKGNLASEENIFSQFIMSYEVYKGA